MPDESNPATAQDWRALLAEIDPDNQQRQQQRLTETLQQRARQYAAAMIRPAPLTEDEAYTILMFRLGSERYALDIQAIRGVRPLSRMTRVPGTPSFYRGVVNLRGQIVSVIDLRAYFGVPMVEERSPKELILTHAAGLDLALLAHHIEDVATLPKAAIEPVEIRSARGIAPGRLIVLDAEQLFSDERLIVGESAESNGPYT